MSRSSALQLKLHWLMLCTWWKREVQRLLQLYLPSNPRVKVRRCTATLMSCRTASVALIFYHLFRWTHLFPSLAHQQHDSSISSHSQKTQNNPPPTPSPTTQRMMSRSDLPHCLWQIFQPLSFSLWRHSDLEDKTLMLAVIPHNSFQIGEADWMTIQWLTENDFTNMTNWWMLSKVDTVFILWYCAHCYALWCV